MQASSAKDTEPQQRCERLSVPTCCVHWGLPAGIAVPTAPHNPCVSLAASYVLQVNLHTAYDMECIKQLTISGSEPERLYAEACT